MLISVKVCGSEETCLAQSHSQLSACLRSFCATSKLNEGGEGVGNFIPGDREELCLSFFSSSILLLPLALVVGGGPRIISVCL